MKELEKSSLNLDKKVLGLRYDKAELSTYKSEWKELYKKEERLLYSTLEGYIIKVEHIGSTAVPDLVAKPILDIMIAVEEIETGAKCINPLLNLGYCHFGECGRPGRIFFVKEEQGVTTHHLHLVEEKSKYWEKNLLFRDLLCNNKKIAQKYAQLKKELAQKFNRNRDAYREGKSEFIDLILAKYSCNIDK